LWHFLLNIPNKLCKILVLPGESERKIGKLAKRRKRARKKCKILVESKSGFQKAEPCH